MSSDFSAIDPSLGYLYQIRLALYLLLDDKEEAKISVESLDDVVLERNQGTELIQIKHHTKTASLTDKSIDLWKTLRIWCSHILNQEIDLDDTQLTLVTTGVAPEGSASSFLRPDNIRDESKAIELLENAASTSKNEALVDSFEKFNSISTEQKRRLISAIVILDRHPLISNVKNQIQKKLEFSVSPENIEGLYNRLEGWWLDKIIVLFVKKSNQLISRFEVHNKILEISRQFSPDALPIDFLDRFPPETPNPESDSRRFVLQLKAIVLHNKRIEKAIIDYYRAFSQRSKWIREDLLLGDEELQRYERVLIDEWERHFYSIREQIPEEADEGDLRQYGRELYNWMDMGADFRIRPEVSEPYVMRGSYHILANNDPPQIYWHPKFIEILEGLLAGKV